MNTYKFHELSKKVQDILIEDEIMFQSEYWYDNVVLDKWVEILENEIGLNNVKISYCGFGNQGDGASFTCGWTLVSVKMLYGIAKLTGMPDNFINMKGKLVGHDSGGYLSAELCMRILEGLYYHENSPQFEFDWNIGEDYDLSKQIGQWIEKSCREIMRKIYKELEDEFEYQTSEEQARSYLEEMGGPYTEDGRCMEVVQ